MFKKIYGLVLFLLFSLTACGQDAEDIPPPSHAEPDHSIYDWKTEDWRYSDEMYTGGTYYLEKYISGLEYQPEQEYDNIFSQYRCLGANIYALSEYSMYNDSSDNNLFYLNCYEDTTGEIWHRRIELPMMEEYRNMVFSVSSFDILNPQEYVLFVNVLEEEKTRAYLAMHFSMEGDFLSAIDLYPAMQASEGCIIESATGQTFFTNVYVDGEEQYFLEADNRVVVLDAAGKPLAELTWDKEDSTAFYAMKTAQGEPVFELHSNAEQERCLVMYDSTASQGRFFTQQLPFTAPKAISNDNVLYYGDSGSLYRWNLYTGDNGICFNYEKLGLGRNNFMTHIAISDTGFPLILDRSREKAIICKLGPEPGEEGDPIRLASLVKDSSFINSSAVMFSQEHMEHPILMQQAEGSLADFRTRALADLIAGNGADIYYVSGEDMRSLYEKGVLADLSGVLGEDLRESLYEGALSCGVIDGRQIGLPPEAYVTSLLVSDELWPEDSWTLEEALTVMEEHPEFEKIMTSRRYMAKINALRLLLLQDLPNSPFLDMDAGTCDFNNPLFIRALEMVDEATGDNSSPSIMKEGEAASFYPNMENFVDFSDEMSRMGEGFHPVGFPTEAENGSYWNADYFLVVSAQAEHRELIDAYLASLFGWQRQRELSHPVRNDILEKSIVYMDDYPTELPWKYSTGGGQYHGLRTKPDGSPWTEEYKDILDRAVSRPQNTYYIEDIILEEARTYLSGVKTAKQVAEIIQNRVQLYLNEQQ